MVELVGPTACESGVVHVSIRHWRRRAVRPTTLIKIACRWCFLARGLSRRRAPEWSRREPL